MVFFIVFILGAVLLGAGSMLAPAWPTAQPRIGTAAAFALALVVGGSVFWAELFGWSTLVVDYLLFALVSIVILSGTMAQAQHPTDNEDDETDEIEDKDVGWTGPEDLTFFALVALLFMMPLFIWVFPHGDHAAANALITLAARDGASFDSFAPYFPDTIGLFPPGFHALAAYLSAQLGQPIPQIHMAIGAVLGLLAVWAAYDFGGEIQDKRLGRAFALALLLSFGLLRMYLDSYYPQMMGIVFAFAFATYAVRVVRHYLLLDMVAAGLMLGAIVIVSPMMFVPVFIGYLIFLAANTLPKRIEKGIPPQHITFLAHLGRWLVVPLVAFLGTLPWLLHAWDVLHEPYLDLLDPRGYVIPLLETQGFWMLPLVMIGVFVAWCKYRAIVLWNVSWLITSHLIYRLPEDWPIQEMLNLRAGVHRIALTPIIPYALLSGFALWWIFEHLPNWTRDMLRQTIYIQAVLALCAIVILTPLGMGFFYDDPIAATKADLAAMQWLMDNAPDARVLNHPSDDWFIPTTGVNPSMSELPSQTQSVLGIFDDYSLWQFWQSVNETLLRDFEIDYIIVPDWTSHPPISSASPFVGNVDELPDMPFLEVVFEQDGAVVYRVLADE